MIATPDAPADVLRMQRADGTMYRHATVTVAPKDEGTETRAFCVRHPDNPDRIKAIAVPEDIKALCS